MKKLFLSLSIIALSYAGWAQCVPDGSITQPGLSPADSTLPCIERTVPYAQTIQFKNFTTIDGAALGFPGVTITIDSIRIDSINNRPAGINYSCNNGDCVYTSGENGCINVFGTTTAAAGDYNLGFYATAWVTAFGTSLGAQQVDSATLAAAGLKYVLTVINQGAPCPNVAAFGVSITGPGQACTGDNVTLTTSLSGPHQGNVTYVWSTGSNADSIVVTSPDTVFVTVTDSGGSSATDTFMIAGLNAPVASFTATTNGAQATATSTSTGNPTSTVFTVLGMDTNTTGVFTFTANGDYTIYLLASNACGSDTSSQVVTITGVSVPEINNINASISLYPNPTNGKVQLTISSAVANENYSVKVYNMQGREVYSADYSGNVNAAIDMENVSAGVYFVHINSKNVSSVEKLLIK
jgi:hypothetical protein